MIKPKLYFVFSLISVCAASETFAAKGLAIKLDVADDDQDRINKKIRTPVGMQQKSARHHVTVGYIDKNLSDKKMDELGKKLIAQLDAIFHVSVPNNGIKFDVNEVVQPFGNVVALVPADDSVLREVNKKTNDLVRQLKYQLNRLTVPGNYTPHMTLSSKLRDVQHLARLNQVIATLKRQGNGKLFLN